MYKRLRGGTGLLGEGPATLLATFSGEGMPRQSCKLIGLRKMVAVSMEERVLQQEGSHKITFNKCKY